MPQCVVGDGRHVLHHDHVGGPAAEVEREVAVLVHPQVVEPGLARPGGGWPRGSPGAGPTPTPRCAGWLAATTAAVSPSPHPRWTKRSRCGDVRRALAREQGGGGEPGGRQLAREPRRRQGRPSRGDTLARSADRCDAAPMIKVGLQIPNFTYPGRGARAALRARGGDRRGRRGGRRRHRDGDGPLLPAAPAGPAGARDVRGVHAARRHRRPHAHGQAGHARHRGHLPEPGDPGQDRHHAST